MGSSLLRRAGARGGPCGAVLLAMCGVASACSSGDPGAGSGGGSGAEATGGAGTGGTRSGSGGSPLAGGGRTSDGGTSGAGGSATGGAEGGGAGGGFADGCPAELVGWATEAGDELSGVTGGGNTAPVTPTTLAELRGYAEDAEPRVIHIAGSWDLEGHLQLGSEKTLLGVGADAELRGGLRIRGMAGAFVENVIVRNLHIDGATSDADGDAVQIHFAHHVWIDHSDIFDAADGNLDIVHGSNWVTLSWNVFHYTSGAPDPAHRFSSLIGHDDDNSGEDEGRLKVTLHHNWWSDGVLERMPRVRFGEVHSFNNYFSSSESNYCIRAGRGAHILAEGNFFDGVSSPHQFNSGADEATAHITARENVYQDTTGADGTSGGGTPFVDPPYDYALDAAEDVPDLVQECAGPRG